MKKIKAYLVRQKIGKAKRGIYFWETLARIQSSPSQEIIPCEITLKVLNKKNVNRK